LKLAVVPIEPEDLLQAPLVEIDEWGRRTIVRWDCTNARADGVAYDYKRERAYVTITQEGRRRLSCLLGEYGVVIIFNGETVGAAEAPPGNEKALLLAVRRALLRPGSLAVEVHGRG
jgi:hypothetical protein